VDWAGRFAFASEVRALLTLPWAPRRLDAIGVLGYLSYGAVQEPYTLVAGIQSLAPAHTLTIELGPEEPYRERTGAYWRMPVRTERTNGVTVKKRGRSAAGARRIGPAAYGRRLPGWRVSLRRSRFSAIAALMCPPADRRAQGLTVAFDDAGLTRPPSRGKSLELMASSTSRFGSNPAIFRRVEQWFADQDQPGSDGAIPG